MGEFWNWLSNFLNEHWQDLALGGGILFNCLRTPKTAAEKAARKKAKAHARTIKAEKKLKATLEKEAALEKGEQNEYCSI